MSRFTRTQAGSAHIVLLLVVVLVAAIGVAGYRVMSANKDTNSSTASSTAAPKATATSQSATSTAAPAQIKTKSDVKQAAQALDSDKDTALDPAQLDADLNGLL